MRKKSVKLTVQDLRRLEPDEPREITALEHHVEQLRDETLRLRATEGDLARNKEELERELEALKASQSWRLTAPLRAAKRRLTRR